MHLPALAAWASVAALVIATLPVTAVTATVAVASPVTATAESPTESPDGAAAAVVQPADGQLDPVPAPEESTPTAQDLLAEARGLFTPEVAEPRARARTAAPAEPRHDPTMTLLQLQLSRGQLTPAQRAEVDAITARPTGPNPNFQYPSASRVKNTCLKRICVHWATAGDDAPPRADSNRDGVPNQVDATMAVLQEVWTEIVDRGGYKAPKKDKGTKARPKQGPNRKFDVYLANLSRFRIFGYCTIDPTTIKKVNRKGWGLPAYCVLDDDFDPAEYDSTKTAHQLLRVTAAHEFFHAVQFAYDAGEDPWMLEGTAAWIEDEIYDDVNDNLIFLRRSQAVDPTRPLDFGKNRWAYGSWIWWRYLSERFPETKKTTLPVIVRDVWRKADASAAKQKKRGTYSIRATKQALKARKVNLTRVYADFGEALRRPAASFEEGASYPQAPLMASYTLSAASPAIPEQVATMPHLTNYTVAFRTGSGLSGSWKLHLKVDGPPKKRGSFARATVYRVGGGHSVKTIKLNKKGRGTRTLNFDRSKVSRVELTMTNAGIRYKCGKKTVYSCAGKPRDAGQKFFFVAAARQSS